MNNFPFRIFRIHGRLTIQYQTGFKLHDTERYILHAYSHLLPFNGQPSTLTDYASMIERHYSQHTPRNAMAVRIIRELDASYQTTYNPAQP